MKNLNPYSTKPFFAVYENIVNSKDEPNKTILTNLKSIINNRYDLYETNFNSKTLEVIATEFFINSDKEALENCYSKNSTLARLKIDIASLQSRAIRGTCQYCTIDSPHTMDHYLPKDKFPDYSVNPINLIPCCEHCNSTKTNKWLDGKGKPYFLNLYLDKLPEKQYLFVTINYVGDEIIPEFEIRNDNKIDAELFQRISTHYERLKLPGRFKEKSGEVITQFIDSSLPLIGSFKSLTETVMEDIEASRKNFGYNYWKNILKEALVKDKHFNAKFLVS